MTATSTPAAAERLRQVEVMGIPLHTFTMESVIRHLIDESSAGDGGYVVTLNLDNLYAVSRDRELRDRALAAEIRVADGMPLVWASRIKGDPLPGRVPGSDLISQLADEIAAAGKPCSCSAASPASPIGPRTPCASAHPASRSPAPTARRTASSTTPMRWHASRQHWWRPSRTSCTSGCHSPRPARWPRLLRQTCLRPGSWAWGPASACRRRGRPRPAVDAAPAAERPASPAPGATSPSAPLSDGGRAVRGAPVLDLVPRATAPRDEERTTSHRGTRTAQRPPSSRCIGPRPH